MRNEGEITHSETIQLFLARRVEAKERTRFIFNAGTARVLW